MKKVIGLFLVIILSTVSAFAHKKHHGGRNGQYKNTSKNWDKVCEDLKLNEKQTADFRKINEDYKQKMLKEREGLKGERQKHQTKMLAMRDERKQEIKKVLTDEQYQQYLEKQTRRGEHRRDKSRK